MIELLPYQQKWVDDKSPFKMCLHRRRVGMSFAEAYGVVTTVRSGINCIVVTPRYYASWLSEIGYIAADQGLSFTKSYKTGCVTLSFKNDNFVALISENSLNELRGFAGKVVIDDAIWIDELDRIFHMVMPLLFFGDSQISVISAIDTFEKKPASFDPKNALVSVTGTHAPTPALLDPFTEPLHPIPPSDPPNLSHPSPPSPVRARK